MKIQITFKTPDAGEEEIVTLAWQQLPSHAEDCEYEEKKQQIKEMLSKWIEYGEYVTIEFDLDAGTAKVIPCK